MKPTVDQLAERCGDVDERLVRQHLERLDGDYFKLFDLPLIARHVQGLSKLSRDNNVEVLVEGDAPQNVRCTVLATDYPSAFSVITGVLAGSAFNVDSGEVFTYHKARPPESRKRRPRPTHRRRTSGSAVDPIRQRRIIDCFEGQILSDQSIETWASELHDRLESVFDLLGRPGEEGPREARHRVNEMVTDRLAQTRSTGPNMLLPVDIETKQTGERTRLTVRSQDTPAFLYSLSNALSLQDMSIERARIRTLGGQIEDEIEFVDLRGNPVTDPEALDRVRFSVLLTKQFTYFLDRAPDPYTALSRFEKLASDLLRRPESGDWWEMLADPRAMQNLARLLGASDYLWEDFIRLQYDALLPIVGPHIPGEQVSDSPSEMAERLDAAIAAAKTPAQKRKALNQFKDQETFLIDLDHVLGERDDFRTFAERLTGLAELVVDRAVKLVYDNLGEDFGEPRTEHGELAHYAVFGLGKLGGVALGYASDIELLFVYDRGGKTDGQQQIENANFFDRLVSEVVKYIEAKREGIFRVDLRLRPYGRNGPLASSEEMFEKYYAPGGEAHSMERLALARMRAIAGEQSLGRRLEQLRDRYLYETSDVLDLDELREVRQKQFEEKRQGDRPNAKYSPGTLVDLEYAVQILQVRNARQSEALRTPRIHRALSALKDERILEPAEANRLNEAYDFLRRLINALRMLRGHAKDLFLPSAGSDELQYLARRMGYEPDDVSPSRQLHFDFETQTAIVRRFVIKHFGAAMLPEPGLSNVVDVVLNQDIPDHVGQAIVASVGFGDPPRSVRNLRRLGGGDRRYLFGRLAVVACERIAHGDEPDKVLQRWSDLVEKHPAPQAHFHRLLDKPRRQRALVDLLIAGGEPVQRMMAEPQLADEPEKMTARVESA